MINEEANQPVVPIDVSDANKPSRSLERQKQDDRPKPDREKQDLTYEMEEENQTAHEQNITAHIPGGGAISDS